MKTAQTHSTRVAADNALAAEKRLTPVGCRDGYTPVSYTHLTLPTNREV